MIARLLALALALGLAVPAAAQELGGLARIDPLESRIADTDGGAEIALSLSQPVPYRLYTLVAPPRLLIEFREVDFVGLEPADLLRPGAVTGIGFDRPRPGWTRLTAELARPMGLVTAGMATDADTGRARLRVSLEPVDADRFLAGAGAPEVAGLPAPSLAPAAPATSPRVIAIDPGHGGVDPGAQRGGADEADLMLSLGIELSEALVRAGFRAVLTRTDDSFVPLSARMTIARSAGAGALISLHADALENGGARGASVYTLSAAGAGGAAERMAERHERGDLLAGLDLSGQDDRVATVLMDLAQAQTRPASEALADAIVTGLRGAGAPLNSRPRREGRLAVLSSADIPSVLLEAGFLSDARDRAALASPEGRAPIVAGLVTALSDWADAQEARAPLLRR